MGRLASLTVAALALAVGPGVRAQTPIPPPTGDFVNAVAQANEYEIDAAQDAAVQSHDPQVQAFAQRMIADHTRLAENLRRAAVADGLPPPPPSLGENSRLLSALQASRGPDFDRLYAKQQVLAHVEAVDVVGGYARAGADPPIRAAAAAAMPVIRHHLEMARRLRASLGGE